MNRRKERGVVRKQPLTEEMIDHLREFIRSRFYAEHLVSFQKDWPGLRSRVVFYPARWFNERGVTVLPAEYGAILKEVLQGVLEHRIQGEIKWLPAYLGHCVEKHFALHGEEHYDRAKRLRTIADNALAVAGIRAPQMTDVVGELVRTERLLRAAKGTGKRAPKPKVNEQLTML